MAELNTAQKAPIIVTQVDGTPAPINSSGVDDPAIGSIQQVGPDTFLVANGVGSANLHINSGVQTGVLPFTVTAAPLVITLGAPVPK